MGVRICSITSNEENATAAVNNSINAVPNLISRHHCLAKLLRKRHELTEKGQRHRKAHFVMKPK